MAREPQEVSIIISKAFYAAFLTGRADILISKKKQGHSGDWFSVAQDQFVIQSEPYKVTSGHVADHLWSRVGALSKQDFIESYEAAGMGAYRKDKPFYVHELRPRIDGDTHKCAYMDEMVKDVKRVGKMWYMTVGEKDMTLGIPIINCPYCRAVLKAVT